MINGVLSTFCRAGLLYLDTMDYGAVAYISLGYNITKVIISQLSNLSYYGFTRLQPQLGRQHPEIVSLVSKNVASKVRTNQAKMGIVPMVGYMNFENMSNTL